MKKKRPVIKIGFDFDKVFVDYPPFIPERLINKLYKKSSNNLSYRIPGKLEQKIRKLSHFPLFRPPIKANVKALEHIAVNSDLEIYLVSSRFNFLKKRTEDWLSRHKIKSHFKKLYFNFKDEQPHIFKSKIIEDLGIKIYVDDDLDLLKYLLKKNRSLKLYWVTKSKKGGQPKNIHPIKTLNELNDVKLKL